MLFVSCRVNIVRSLRRYSAITSAPSRHVPTISSPDVSTSFPDPSGFPALNMPSKYAYYLAFPRQTTLTVGQIRVPFALVPVAVGEHLSAIAFALTIYPLALVHGHVRELHPNNRT